MSAGKPLLSIRDLSIDYYTLSGIIHAVRRVDLELCSAESLCIVGESGSGKSTLGVALSLALPPNAIVKSGSIVYSDIDLLRARRDIINKIKGREITMIFQDPLATFSPLHTIGEHLEDIAISKLRVSRRDASNIVIDVLKKVRMPDVDRVLKSYPHELSGGMLQRAAIGAAILTKPKIIVADEPTSMLDATIQAQILSLLKELVKSEGMSLVLITHNLGVALRVCEKTAIMYAGVIVEDGGTLDIIKEPLHPYTRSLLAAIPRSSHRVSRIVHIQGEPLDPRLEVSGCPFADRCPSARGECSESVKYVRIGDRRVYCNLYSR
jgi:oligopeptide/dipeptide ABC transporter ATP-binding protein